MKRFALACTILLTMHHSAYSASGAGNGADGSHYSFGHSWLLGEQTVTFCIEVGDGFYKEADQEIDLQAQIQQAWNIWRNYIKVRQINMNPDPRFHLPVSHPLKFQKSCEKDTNLRFLFGRLTRAVKEELSFQREPAWAFSKLLDYRDGRGTGYVWIAPEKQFRFKFSDKVIRMLLLHEMGHILGCGHLNFTIMREPFLLEPLLEGLDDPRYGRYLDQIDHERYLSAPEYRKYELARESLSGDTAWPFIKKSFLNVFGKDLKEESQIVVESFWDQTARFHKKKYKIRILGEEAEYVIAPYHYMSISDAEGRVFRRYLNKSSKYPEGFLDDGFQRSYGFSLLGLLETNSGHWPVSISDNMGTAFSGFSISLIPSGPLGSVSDLSDFDHVLFDGEPAQAK